MTYRTSLGKVSNPVSYYVNFYKSLSIQYPKQIITKNLINEALAKEHITVNFIHEDGAVEAFLEFNNENDYKAFVKKWTI
jgi:hypothetical protein